MDIYKCMIKRKNMFFLSITQILGPDYLFDFVYIIVCIYIPNKKESIDLTYIGFLINILLYRYDSNHVISNVICM